MTPLSRVGLNILLISMFTFVCLASDSDERSDDYAPQISDSSSEGAQAIGAFQVPEFLKPRLVAAEPALANPVAFTFDSLGRVYVAETFRQKKGVEDNRSHMDWLLDDLAAQSVDDRLAYFKKHLEDRLIDYAVEHDRIRVLEDTNQDGVYDQSTVFADGFNAVEDGTGAGVLAIDGDVYYTCIPKLYLLRDLNGDSKVDVRTALQDGFGVRVAFRGHDMHGLTLGPDGRIYFSIGDRGYNVLTTEGIRLKRPDTGAVFRCERDGTRLEVFAYGLRNPQELAFDDFGNLFTGDNNSDSGDQARWVYVVEEGDSGWRMYYQYLPDRGPWYRERMWYPYHDDAETQLVQPSYILPPVANLADGPSGLTYYPGVGLPSRYLRHFFMADFRGTSSNSGIRSFSVETHGAGFRLTDSHQFLWSILATDVDFGYDGNLYVTDWVNGWDGPGKGRLYQFGSEYDFELRKQVVTLFQQGFGEIEPDLLLQQFSHPDRRVRQASQFELVKRIQDEQLEVTLLLEALEVTKPQFARLHAIWGLGQLLRSDHLNHVHLAGMVQYLNDEDVEVRAQIARVLGEGTQSGIPDDCIRLMAGDQSLRVKHLAALSYGRAFPLTGRKVTDAETDIRVILQILDEYSRKDPVLRHSAVMALVGIGKVYPELLVSATEAAGDPGRMGILLALRRLQDSNLSKFLDDANPEIVLSAARAIHDEPLESLTDELAKLAQQRQHYSVDPLMRRVLHAAFRLGTAEMVQAVASVAVDESASLAVRVFATELLVAWNRPQSLDLVTGAWRPLQRTSVLELSDLIRPYVHRLLASDEKIRSLAIQLASMNEIADVNPLLWSIFSNRNEAISNRVAALNALDHLEDEKVREGLQVALGSDEPELRSAGRSILLQIDPEAALPLLEEAIKSGTSVERQQAISGIASLKKKPAIEILFRLSQELLAGTLAPEIQLDVLQAAQKKSESRFVKLLEDYERQMALGKSPLHRYQVTLYGGDAAQGYDIFFGRSDASCRRCHQINGSGGAVGPDLSKVGKEKSREYLLESLVTPNVKIAKGFETTILVLDSGKVVTGLVKMEDEKELSIMLSDGTLVRVDKQQVEERVPGRSGMPDDLIKKLSLADVRDLIAYMSSLKNETPSDRHQE